MDNNLPSVPDYILLAPFSEKRKIQRSAAPHGPRTHTPRFSQVLPLLDTPRGLLSHCICAHRNAYDGQTSAVPSSHKQRQRCLFANGCGAHLF